MKEYIEQRIEKLETEMRLLSAKIKLHETKDTSKYVNQYEKYNPPSSNYDPSRHYVYNASVNLMSNPTLNTAVSTSYNKKETIEAPLVSLTVPSHLDSDFNSYQISVKPEQPADIDSDFPPYPDIIDSWNVNQDDAVDEYGFKLNWDQKPNTDWGFLSKYDKEDKNFLDWIKTNGKKAYKESKLKSNNLVDTCSNPFDKC